MESNFALHPICIIFAVRTGHTRSVPAFVIHISSKIEYKKYGKKRQRCDHPDLQRERKY